MPNLFASAFRGFRVLKDFNSIKDFKDFIVLNGLKNLNDFLVRPAPHARVAHIRRLNRKKSAKNAVNPNFIHIFATI